MSMVITFPPGISYFEGEEVLNQKIANILLTRETSKLDDLGKALDELNRDNDVTGNTYEWGLSYVYSPGYGDNGRRVLYG